MTDVAGVGADDVLELVRMLFDGSKAGSGPIRMESWNSWTDDQRRAYISLQHLVGLGEELKRRRSKQVTSG